MGKKKKNDRTDPTEGRPDEFGGDIEDREIIEYNPDEKDSPLNAEPEQARSATGNLAPERELLQAKAELIARLGGAETLAAAAEAAVSAGHVGLENFQAIGVGLKETRGRYTGDLAVKVFVREKLPSSRLEKRAAVPEEVNGYPTDIEVIGEISAYSYTRRYERPVPCGASFCEDLVGAFEESMTRLYSVLGVSPFVPEMKVKRMSRGPLQERIGNWAS